MVAIAIARLNLRNARVVPFRRSLFVLLALTLAPAPVHRQAGAALYSRTTGAGPFRQSTLWSPYFPPTLAGPGDADDVVRFNLGASADAPYTVTSVQGENDRLLVGNDAVILNIGQYSLTNDSLYDTSLTLGLATGDLAIVSMEGSAGSHLGTKSIRVADATDSTASLTARGIEWDIIGLAIIGNRGSGNLRIYDGAHVQAGQTFLGWNAIGAGHVIVDGPESTLSASGITHVGEVGQGYVNVGHGGQLSTPIAFVGEYPNSVGYISVFGVGSTWTNSDYLRIGPHGTGQLVVSDGGYATANRAAVGVFQDGTGWVSVSQPGSTWEIADTLSIGGDISNGETQGHGTVLVEEAGRISVGGATAIYAGGVLNLQGGSFQAATIALQGGAFNWTGGALSVGTYNGNLTNASGILAPGDATGSTTIAGSYTQLAQGTLAIDIGGTSAGSTYDSVGVAGSALLAGTLELSLANGFVPHAVDTFSVFNAVGGVLGVLSNVGSGQRLTLENGAGSFLVNYGVTSAYNPNQVVLSSFLPTFTADFDLDGDVDAADLQVWKSAAGVSALADANGDGDSDGDDFLAWQRQLGSSVPSAAIAAAVPEPGAACLAVVAALGLAARSKRFGRLGR